METVLNRLRSTVSTVTSTVSQLSVVLPGNPVTREYDIQEHIGSGGPELLWKIYSGVKKSTREAGSVFVFEKKELDRWGRKERDGVLDTLRKGVLQLTRLRHPRILTVQHPLEESRDSLAFVTEPVQGSLANVLGKSELHPLDLKYGLLQVSDGLSFLHKDAKLLHGNLSPEALILSAQGAWKIFALDFAVVRKTDGEGGWSCLERGYSMDRLCPSLDYLAPEYLISNSCSPASDLFSLGMVTLSALNQGQALFPSGGNLEAAKQNMDKLKRIPEGKLKTVPIELRPILKALLSFSPETRPGAEIFQSTPYLSEDEGVKTLRYLDTLLQWENLQKSKFYKGLPHLLPTLPHHIRLRRVVGCLAQEFVNPSMVPFVLPNVLRIAQDATAKEFQTYILPHLIQVFPLREPIQILLIWMKWMEVLLEKCPEELTKREVLPLIYAALETDALEVQELALAVIPRVFSLIQFSEVKNALLPRLRKTALATHNLSVVVNCLLCLAKILERLEKWLVLDFVLPFITEIPSREPAVLMTILGILKVTVTCPSLGLPKEVIASRVLPFLFPLSLESGLSLAQFEALIAFIRDLVGQVEKEQRAKLAAIEPLRQTDMKLPLGDVGSVNMNEIFGELVKPVPNGATPTSEKHRAISPLEPYKYPVAENTRSNLTKDLTNSLIQAQINQIRPSSQSMRDMANVNQQEFRFQGPTISIPFRTPFNAQSAAAFQAPINHPQSKFVTTNPSSMKTLSQKDIDDLLS